MLRRTVRATHNPPVTKPRKLGPADRVGADREERTVERLHHPGQPVDHLAQPIGCDTADLEIPTVYRGILRAEVAMISAG